jgi:hypothetical protein
MCVIYIRDRVCSGRGTDGRELRVGCRNDVLLKLEAVVKNAGLGIF